MSQEFWSSQRNAFLNSSISRTPQTPPLPSCDESSQLDHRTTIPWRPPVLGDPSQQTTTTWTGLRTSPRPDPVPTNVPSRSGFQSSLQVSAERLLTEMKSRDRLPKEELKNLQIELQRNGEEQQTLIRIVNELSHQITESDSHSKERMKRIELMLKQILTMIKASEKSEIGQREAPGEIQEKGKVQSPDLELLSSDDYPMLSPTLVGAKETELVQRQLQKHREKRQKKRALKAKQMNTQRRKYSAK